MDHREAKLNSGELTAVTYRDYKRAGAFLVDSLGRYTDVEGLEPSDFQKLRGILSKRSVRLRHHWRALAQLWYRDDWRDLPWHYDGPLGVGNEIVLAIVVLTERRHAPTQRGQTLQLAGWCFQDFDKQIKKIISENIPEE